MLEVYKPHTNSKEVGVWLYSAAKRLSKRSALVSKVSTGRKGGGEIVMPAPSDSNIGRATLRYCIVHIIIT